jgi:hypothetical protein
MVLAQTGVTVTGTYEWQNGQINGTVTGSLFSGQWSEGPSYIPPDDAGDIELTLDAGCNSFTGKWRYGFEGDDWGNWDGTRIGAATATPTGTRTPTRTATRTPTRTPTGKMGPTATRTVGATATGTRTATATQPPGSQNWTLHLPIVVRSVSPGSAGRSQLIKEPE